MIYCLVCGEEGELTEHGYAFCGEHWKYSIIDPESLEMLVIWRLGGESIEFVESKLDDVLRVYTKQ